MRKLCSIISIFLLTTTASTAQAGPIEVVGSGPVTAAEAAQMCGNGPANTESAVKVEFGKPMQAVDVSDASLIKIKQGTVHAVRVTYRINVSGTYDANQNQFITGIRIGYLQKDAFGELICMSKGARK